MLRFFLFFLFLFSWQCSFAQLGFCEGSKGDPIFHQDFGSGSGTGPELPAGTTNYTYVSGIPAPGEYSVLDEISPDSPWWHRDLPETTLSGGRFLLVDAGYEPGLFFETEISGLCENTSYEFSAFLMNIFDAGHDLCNYREIPINVKFEIWDETGTNLLGEGSTGNIHSTVAAEWEQYALTFQSAAGQDSVILRMYNNGEGGCGNDVAIDDIVFKSCGDLTTITSEVNDQDEAVFCDGEVPVNIELLATPDHSVYEEHAFQWQESDNNTDWQNIPGETGQSFVTPSLSESKYYRVKVAEDEVNLDNNLCSSASTPYYVNILDIPEAPISKGDVAVCSGDDIPILEVEVGDDETVNWYDSAVNGNLLAEGTTSYRPEGEGVFYAEAINTKGCEAGPRTAMSLHVYQVPEVEDETVGLCAEGELQLDALIENVEYEWSTGEKTRQIYVSTPGNYSVEIITSEGCRVTKNFEVTSVPMAAIDDIYSEENNVVIVPANEGEFEYSLDGSNFQSSNIFESISSGIYMVSIRDLYSCNTSTEEFPHIVAPQFITPNGDGYNDSFKLNGLEYFSSSKIMIFDRYGKLIKSANGENFSWDGNLNGRQMPSADYWYHIIIEDFRTIKGNFSLIR